MPFRPIVQALSRALLGCVLSGVAAVHAQKVCTIEPWLPAEYAVFHVGANGGSTVLSTAIEFDNSGRPVTQIDVVVNYPTKPVVLALTAHNPVLWNVRWAPDSKVVGAYVAGSQAQGIIGIPRWIPLLLTSRDRELRKEPGVCPAYVVAGANKDLKWTKNYTGREAESSVEAARNGPTWIGEKDPSLLPKLLSSDQYTIADFSIKRNSNDVPTGAVGLKLLVAKGYLREATIGDYWFAMSPSTMVGRVLRGKIPTYVPHQRAYLVLRKMTIPRDVPGWPIFIVPRGVPQPDGPIPGSTVYLGADGMKCIAPVCRDDSQL